MSFYPCFIGKVVTRHGSYPASKGWIPLRKKASDRTRLFRLVLSARSDQKNLKILQLFIIWVVDHRFKLEQKIGYRKPTHAPVQFCSDLFRSHADFPEWKSALIHSYICNPICSPYICMVTFVVFDANIMRTVVELRTSLLYQDAFKFFPLRLSESCRWKE